jgi:F-type H+-transporting ATPase subunit delta
MATISNNDIAKAIYLTYLNKKDNDSKLYLKNVVKFLDRRRLLSKKEDILLKLNKIKNQHEGIKEVLVKTAEKLSHETKQNLIKMLTKRYSSRDIVLNEIIDESLIGGVKLEVDDEVIDLTIKNKIKKLQQHLIRYEQ